MLPQGLARMGVYAAYFAGIWCAVGRLWCLANHGGCPEYCENLINVSTEHQ